MLLCWVTPAPEAPGAVPGASRRSQLQRPQASRQPLVTVARGSRRPLVTAARGARARRCCMRRCAARRATPRACRQSARRDCGLPRACWQSAVPRACRQSAVPRACRQSAVLRACRQSAEPWACRWSAGRDCADRARACGPPPLAHAQYGAPLVGAQYGARARRSAAGGCVSRFVRYLGRYLGRHLGRYLGCVSRFGWCRCPARPWYSGRRVSFVPSIRAGGPRARRVGDGARRVGNGAVARSGARALSAVLSASTTRRAWRVGSASLVASHPASLCVRAPQSPQG
jgi:hypothetical protein